MPIFHRSIIIAFGLAAFAAAPALADDLETLDLQNKPERTDRQQASSGTMPIAMLLASFDQDGDYAISPDELAAGSDMAFAVADQNGNGALTLFELSDWRKLALGSADAMPGNFPFDPNIDQRVTPEEFAAVMQQSFDRADQNSDGGVSFAELTQAFKVRPQRARGPQSDGEERARPPQGERGGRGGRR